MTIKLLSLSTFLLLLCSCEELVPGLDSNGSSSNSNIYIDLGENLKHTNALLDKTLTEELTQMEDWVNERPQYNPLRVATQSAKQKFNKLTSTIDEICEQLQVETLDFKSNTNSKSITQKVLFESGKIAELQGLIKKNQAEVWAQLDELIQYAGEGRIGNIQFNPQNTEKLKANFPLQAIKNDSWAKENFEGLGAAAANAKLRQLESDIKSGLIQLIQFLKNSKTNTLAYDAFTVLSKSQKPYVLLGETFETEIALGAYSTQVDFEATVDGKKLPVQGGLARFQQQPTTVGTQSFMANLIIKNPLTGERIPVRKEFTYEVGAPSAIASLDKMNVLYIGVDNPISISAAGIASKDLQVTVSGGGDARVVSAAPGKYIVTPTRPTGSSEFCNIEVKDKKSNRKLASFPFRVKPIPNPAARLTNNKSDGTITSGEMRTQRGIMAVVEKFDFDVRCEIKSLTLYYTPARQDAVEIMNQGGAFSGKTIQAIQQAKPGSTYQFVNVKGLCPGDKASRKLNSLAFLVR